METFPIILNLIKDSIIDSFLFWDVQTKLRYSRAVITNHFGRHFEVLKVIQLRTVFLASYCRLKSHLESMAVTDMDVCRQCCCKTSTNLFYFPNLQHYMTRFMIAFRRPDCLKSFKLAQPQRHFRRTY